MAARLAALGLVTAAAAGCGASAPSPAPATAQSPSTRSPAATPLAPNSPVSAYGNLTFGGALVASGVGPVSPLPFADVTGGVPTIPLGSSAGGPTAGAAPGTQCYHATSRTDLDQYEALLVVVVHGQRYRLAIATVFAAHPGGGEATPPAGGRMTDAGGSIDEVHLDAEGVPLRDDPMFVASFGDGTVVIAPTLRSGTIDITMHGLAAPGASPPLVRVSGSWTCP